MFVCGQLQSVRGLGNRMVRIVFLQELTIAKLVNKFSAYCGKTKFIAVFIRACHWRIFSPHCHI